MLLLHSRSEQHDDGLYIDAEVAMPLPTLIQGNEQISVHTLPGGLMASTIHSGADLFLGQAYAALYSWIKDNRYRVIAVPRQLRLRYGEHVDANQYVTEVQFPVEKQAVEE